MTIEMTAPHPPVPAPGPEKRGSWLRRMSARVAVPPDPFRFDPRCDRLVRELCDSVAADRWALNLGSGGTELGPRIVNLDLAWHERVHIVGDAHELPFAAGTLDGVLMRGVLEHVAEPESVLREVHRVLRPGGFLYVEVPFLQAYHESPEDYRRFTAPGLEASLADYDLASSGVQIGPFSALSWTLRESIASLVAGGSESRYRRALALAGWLTFWIKYLDAAVAEGRHVRRSASALFALGRKRAAKEA